MRRELDLLHLCALPELVEARECVFVSEKLYQADLAFLQIMKHAPPQLRPGLEQIYRDSKQKEFDPVDCYRDAEASIEESVQNFDRALAAYESEWPEHQDPALRSRMAALETLDASNAWKDEVIARARVHGRTLQLDGNGKATIRVLEG